jgi:hypothetical protein
MNLDDEVGGKKRLWPILNHYPSMSGGTKVSKKKKLYPLHAMEAQGGEEV